uniref:Putative secreted protein n=1 Tax=Anopheles triannulatus TaxID=58253 RepID=A0A2M4B1C7_9DIPT
MFASLFSIFVSARFAPFSTLLVCSFDSSSCVLSTTSTKTVLINVLASPSSEQLTSSSSICCSIFANMTSLTNATTRFMYSSLPGPFSRLFFFSALVSDEVDLVTMACSFVDFACVPAGLRVVCNAMLSWFSDRIMSSSGRTVC